VCARMCKPWNARQMAVNALAEVDASGVSIGST
jgi:hypothetical protein